MSVQLAFTLFGLSISALGAIILLWALFRDRVARRSSRRLRRCPRCWYDMSALPGLRCPECGREAKRERALFRTRRRWCWAAFSTLLILVSIPLARVPLIRAEGWTGAIPTAALILALPWLETTFPSAPVPSNFAAFPAPPAPPPTLYAILLSRLNTEPSHPPWHKALIRWRTVRGDRNRPVGSHAWREHYLTILYIAQNSGGGWISNQVETWLTDDMITSIARRIARRGFQPRVVQASNGRVYIIADWFRNLPGDWRLRLSSAVSGGADSTITRTSQSQTLAPLPPPYGLLDLGPAPVDLDSVTMSASIELHPDQPESSVIWRGSIHAPIMRPAPDAPMPLEPWPRLEARLKAEAWSVLHVTVENGQSNAAIVRELSNFPRPLTHPPGVTAAMLVEAIADDRVVATGVFFFPIPDAQKPAYFSIGLLDHVAFVRGSHSPELTDPKGRRWEIRFSPDPALALLDPRATKCADVNLRMPVYISTAGPEAP